jgi:hypothetical protein
MFITLKFKIHDRPFSAMQPSFLFLDDYYPVLLPLIAMYYATGYFLSVFSIMMQPFGS